VRDALARAAFAQLQVFEREPKPTTVQEEELLEGLRTYKCAGRNSQISPAPLGGAVAFAVLSRS